MTFPSAESPRNDTLGFGAPSAPQSGASRRFRAPPAPDKSGASRRFPGAFGARIRSVADVYVQVAFRSQSLALQHVPLSYDTFNESS